jgi:histidine decarboxylase
MEQKGSVIAFNPVSRYRRYCDGHGSQGALGPGYINALKLETATVTGGKGEILDQIVAYDRAERNGAYMGQINMVAASSFCGPEGWIWGYDLARPRQLYNQVIAEKTQRGGEKLTVYSADPLLKATELLFGTETRRRFPLYPGSIVLCAYKEQTTHAKVSPELDGPVAVWCYISVSIAADRDNSADLFIEDTGVYTGNDSTTEEDVRRWLARRVDTVLDSIVECGSNQSVAYKETFISWRFAMLRPDDVATALTCAPYITLAQDAVLNNIRDMRGLSLEEWDERIGPGVGEPR